MPSPSIASRVRRATLQLAGVLAIAAVGTPVSAQSAPTVPAPAVPAPAADATPASPALIDHLLRVLEKREQPQGVGGPFGGSSALSSLSTIDALNAERQLRTLGARAASGAPRVAELLMRTERNAYELAWTLWSISPPATTEQLPELRAALANVSGAARIEVLAKIGRSRSAQAMPELREASQAAELPQRLVAGIALSHQLETAAGDEPARLLAGLLKDREKPVRSVSANGLRLLGTRAQAAVPALIDYLRTRDNVYMATQALAAAPTRDLLPAQGELEAILADTKLSDFQKQPAVQLLMRIEQQRSSEGTTGAVPAPRTPAVVPVRPAVDDARRI